MRLSLEQIYGLLVSVGFPRDRAITFAAIAMAESGGVTTALNSKGEYSVGLFQINMRAHGTRFGTEAELRDPWVNAKAAYQLSRGGSNLQPWSVTHAGNPNHYSKYLPQARAAAQRYLSNPQQYSVPQGSGTGAQQLPPAAGAEAAKQGEELNIPTGGSYLKVGNQYYVAFRFYGTEDRSGPSAVVYYRLDPRQIPKSAKVGTVSPDQLAKWRASGQWVDAGTVDAFRGTPKGTSFQSMVDRVLLELGLSGTDALRDQDVMNIVALALSREMSEAELENRLRRTKWWQSRTDRQREWGRLSEAEKAQRLVDEAMQLAGLWFTYVGVDLRVSQYDRDGDGVISAAELKRGNLALYTWAERVASGQVSQAHVVNAWLKPEAEKNPDSPWGRTKRQEEQAQGQFRVDVENMTQRIRDMYFEWGVPIADVELAKMAEDVVMNRRSEAEVLQMLEEHALSLYPTKPRHMPTRQWAAPWMSTYMQTLEVPEVGLEDPLLQEALTSGMNIAEFRRRLRMDDRWLSTDNARVEFHDKFSTLGRVMGF